MKKILLIIVILLCIFQTVALATDIDIGMAAIDRSSYYGSPRTVVERDNPANASGKITQVEMFFYQSGTDVEIATFYVVSRNNLSTRDTYYIGNVTSGSKQTFTVDLDVEEGDYIGIYFSGGKIETSPTAGGGCWSTYNVDNIPCTNVAFTLDDGANNKTSLYGTGITPPAPPTNVSATDGTYTDKVVITWTKSSGATGYQVYRDSVGLGWLGDVATYDDTGANAPTITVGTASASDGTSTEYVTLSVSGELTNNGTIHTYKVRAKNTAGESGDSGTDSGYRGVGTLTYQWQRSAADSDADYSNISGATTNPYNDTEAPENGDGRYYKCIENASGASQQTTNSDRGYRLYEEEAKDNAVFFGMNF